MVEVIKEIRVAEDKAEEIRRRAQAESRKIIQDAERKASETFQQDVLAAEAEGRELVSSAEKEAQGLVGPVQQRTAEEIQRVINAAQSKQEQAITMVMERIVKTYGHS